MAAISASILALCNTGDHVVASNAVYGEFVLVCGKERERQAVPAALFKTHREKHPTPQPGGTHALFKTFLPLKCGITVTFVDVSDLDAVRAAVSPRTKVIYTESLSNPTLVVADLPALSEIAKAAGAALVVDNTFTPLVMTPADWGADVVVHSLTKFISGSSDIIAGAVCGSAAFIGKLMVRLVCLFILYFSARRLRPNTHLSNNNLTHTTTPPPQKTTTNKKTPGPARGAHHAARAHDGPAHRERAAAAPAAPRRTSAARAEGVMSQQQQQQ